MPQLDPSVERVLVALVQGLRALGVRFCVVGALVPELLLNERLEQATLDADAVVFVPDLRTFERVKAELAGFAPTKYPYRLRHESGGRADILPYSDELAPDGVLRLEPDYVFNMTGFDRVADWVIEVTLESGELVPVVAVPAYVLLKLVAFTDRRLEKDIGGVLHCLRNYAEDDDRRFGLEHDGAPVPYEYGSAYLLARDALPFVDDKLRRLIAPLFDSLIPADLDVNDDDSYRAKENREYLAMVSERSWPVGLLECHDFGSGRARYGVAGRHPGPWRARPRTGADHAVDRLPPQRVVVNVPGRVPLTRPG